jgi:hypothetical protein
LPLSGATGANVTEVLEAVRAALSAPHDEDQAALETRSPVDVL